MYICVCNAIKDHEVRHAVNQGATTPGKIFKSHGCRANCGQCVNHMRDVIEDEASPSEFLEAAE